MSYIKTLYKRITGQAEREARTHERQLSYYYTKDLRTELERANDLAAAWQKRAEEYGQMLYNNGISIRRSTTTLTPAGERARAEYYTTIASLVSKAGK